MRKNLPVTERERTFPKEQQLISSTDIKGTILHCNDAFASISGFSKEELVGKPHNIVRHPDMPEAAFQTMWSYLQQGKPWMGLVKNRCKNGDYYWVNAYVTPITEHGRVVGYESVRTVPSRAQVAHAEQLYKAINAGKNTAKAASDVAADLRWALMPLLAVFVSLLLWWAIGPVAAAIAFVVTALLSYSLGVYRLKQSLSGLVDLMPTAFTDPLAVASYAKHQGRLGQLEVALLAESAHLNTVLTRIEDASTKVAVQSDQVRSLSVDAADSIRKQQMQTEQVATAMNQMTTTIAEVSSHVQDTASKADDADALARSGSTVAAQTRGAMQQLQKTVNDISQSVADLAEQTNKIVGAAQIIEQIAEQTNLLALNAAIEAARAGEQGRGFAVVADEVRLLASRTTASTKEIYDIIQQLSTKAKASVLVAENGRKDAELGVTQVAQTEKVLEGISVAVSSIAAMAGQMAAAVEEQAHVAEDINQQIVSISDLAATSLSQGTAVSKSGKDLQNTSEQLHELVERFRKV
ncbi:MAG: methyl-accepting chemotaxis protein [Gammaproteobacteria bacterium]|nr:methyl-accepting chemotaxis protein [Gammaproteobacteria bacterium]MBU2057314.1 methyl-accepting chemotaxis protein [Gammaproteobacteria bacterium]MBU2174916.1 methyl-accepting chemotaxis protein [Gammaproteobacteria bacterium]MBU2245521.1 methyl-accepting chemotaxis protein [Gammaproteobacteria bacterium]MBU2344445.1 methyl-accepting chemotaxis protein [Gammaproteobacteria bacterium]